tara:strand:- start:237 stop:752 length:516 start_codon:yes stop_codon:yes gene_type:complete
MAQPMSETAETGAAMIETAIALPVFLAITLGTLLYGVFFYSQQSLQRVAHTVGNAVVIVDPTAPDAVARIHALANETFSTEMAARFDSKVASDALGLVTVSQASDTALSPSTRCGPPTGNRVCIIESEDTGAAISVEVTLARPLAELLHHTPRIGLVPLPERVSARSTTYF